MCYSSHVKVLIYNMLEFIMHAFSSYGITVNVEKLFSFADKLQVLEIPVKDLKDRLYDKVWDDEREDNDPEGNFAPIDAFDKRKQGGRYDYHYQKALKADLKYPIIIWKGKVVDGVHRLLKAYIQKDKTIKVVEFKSIPEEVIIRRKPTFLIIEASQEEQQKSKGQSQKFYDDLINFLEQKDFYVHMSSEGNEDLWKDCKYVIAHGKDRRILEITENIPRVEIEESDFEFDYNKINQIITN